MSTIRQLARTAAADRRITKEEAQGLIDKVKADGKVTSYEKAQLRSALSAHADFFTAEAKQLVQAVLAPLPPPPPGQGLALDPTPSQRPVFLGPDGSVTTNASGAAASTPTQRGDALFRAGELVDNARDNVFAGLPLDVRTRVFEQLKPTLSTTAPAGFDARQALQARASSGAVLLHLLEGTKEPALQAQLLAAYEGLVKAEPDKRLQENFVFHLSNSPAAKTAPVKAVAEALLPALAPLTPPYEKWFKNGNTTVKLDWQVGDEFLAGFRKKLTSDGWKETAAGSGVYEKAFTEPGIGETTFEVRTRLANGGNLLEKLNDPAVHIIGYDGHSGWGKNQVNSLKRAGQLADGGDGKLYLSNLCVGKSQLDALKEKFPNLQVTTTYGSSSVDTDLDGLAKLISKRAGWKDITPFLDRTDGHWDRNNFLTPITTLTREKVLDRDNDGQADYLDKHFNGTWIA